MQHKSNMFATNIQQDDLWTGLVLVLIKIYSPGPRLRLRQDQPLVVSKPILHQHCTELC